MNLLDRHASISNIESYIRACTILENCSLIPYLVHSFRKFYNYYMSNVELLGSLLCTIQSIFPAELCSATIRVVLLALPVLTHVYLHKRWVDREREMAE